MTEEVHKIVIEGDARSAEAAFRRIREGSKRVKDDMANVRGSTDAALASLRNLARAGASLVGLNLGANLVRDTVQLADAWKLVDARIKVSTKSQSDAQAASQGLLDIAKETGAEFEAVGNLFARTNRFVEDNGGNLRDTLTLTRLVTQAARVSGAGVAEQNATIRQLSQALASGVLRGDEFNSVMENAPRLAQALADGLGVPIGALRKMAEEGQLTADVVTKALLGQADKIAKEFSTLPLTVGVAFTNLKTAAGEYVAGVDQANGVSAKLAETIGGLARSLPGLAETFKQLLALGVPAYFLAVARNVNLAELAFKRFIPYAITAASLGKALQLLTAINNERVRQQEIDRQNAQDRADLVAGEHLLNVQLQSLEQYKALGAAAQEFYRKDLQEAIRVAELKLKLNAGRNEKEAFEAARLLRIYRASFAEISTLDGNRAEAMKQHSENVAKAKELELKRLDAVFQAQKQGLKDAEKAFEDARKKREAIIKEFQQLRDDLTGKSQRTTPILAYEVENAVNAAQQAQELAAKAPASEADRLADEAIQKARDAAELLRQFRDQQTATGSSIDAAEAGRLSNLLSERLLKIADDASAVQEQVAQQQVDAMQKIVQDTLTQAEALKQIEVGFDKDGAVKSLDDLIAEVRARAQATPLIIPVQVVSGSLPDSVPGIEDLPKKARGGLIRGPGTGTSDSILARLSHGEYVIRADAVRKLGLARLNAINRGIIPGFSNGGAVLRMANAAPSLSAVPSPSASGDTINLTVPGLGTYRMRAERGESRRLQSDLSLAVLQFGDAK